MVVPTVGFFGQAPGVQAYVNSGLAALAEMRLPRSTLNKRYLLQFLNLKKHVIPSLEPTLKKGRAGGIGKKAKKAKDKRSRKGKENFFSRRERKFFKAP